MFDVESFFVGMLAGLFLFGAFGRIAWAMIKQQVRRNPYAIGKITTK